MGQHEEKQIQQTQSGKKEAVPDILDEMLQNAYALDDVPAEVNIRLKNQLACKAIVDTGRVSFWWLPATISTVVSSLFGIMLCLIYTIVNIKGADFWMPNLLQMISGAWLKLHLAAITFEIAISWVVTFLGMWKGNLVKSAKLF
ncbi:MAG: hypothetical protein NC300_12090 [Bacteroidales bacterium]|nr:hypothetical protein [Clostridium sp.]MCM1204872.1 hypothetical protein [Bacteroidales bacterium]